MKANGMEVVVKDIEMSFWSMVKFMIKWALAAIPAVFVLFIIASAFMAFFTGMIR